VLVLVQWATDPPANWQSVNVDATGSASRAWRNLPSKPVPTGGETINAQTGWVYDLNVQGVTFAGYDHYAVEPVDQGVRVTVWNDDPEDWPAGTRNAAVWTMLTPAMDARYGQFNTRQGLTRYLEQGAPAQYFLPAEASLGPVVVRPWSEFSPPAANITRHGIWLSDELAANHVAAQALRGWRDWVV
jgi:hypothetical protein